MKQTVILTQAVLVIYCALGMMAEAASRNLIDDPRYATKRAELERELSGLSKAAGPDKMPIYVGITNVLPKY